MYLQYTTYRTYRLLWWFWHDWILIGLDWIDRWMDDDISLVYDVIPSFAPFSSLTAHGAYRYLVLTSKYSK
jgi:hypothetical protein